MDSRADPAQEHTPLLGSRRTAEHGANDENGSDGIRVTTLHSYYKFLCIGTASSLGFAVPGLAFMIASAALTSYGARRFSFYEDWNFTVLEEVLGLASFIAIPLAITNLVLLKRRRGQVPSLVNIIYFGSTGLFCVGWAMVYIGDRISNPPSYCPKDLDDPDTGFGSGTYEECLRWAPKHRAVTWIFLILMGLYGSGLTNVCFWWQLLSACFGIDLMQALMRDGTFRKASWHLR
ncbi:Fc.00g114630.m01.CDS01 [Cosmosporella sp. VM-42]